MAPLQIKPKIIEGIDAQIELARQGKPCGLFFKTNSVTDKEIIVKIAEASQAGVPVTMLVRGISCLVPGVPGYTDNVRVVSIVGCLLEHSRIYGFGVGDNARVYLSSADLMTRNMEKRVEIAWPILDDALREQVLQYFDTCLRDTAKLRELLPDGSYTKLGALAEPGQALFDSQNALIKEAQKRRAHAAEAEAQRSAKARFQLTERHRTEMRQAEVRVEAIAAAEAAAANASAAQQPAAHHCTCKHDGAAEAGEGEAHHCKCKHGDAEEAGDEQPKHCACKHDAEGHAISTEPHLGYVADLASLIEIQQESTVSRVVMREDGLRVVLFGFDKDQALSEHTAAMPVTIQVLEGKLRVGGEGREVELVPGGVVYLSARLPHTVYAVEPSKMLLSMFDNRG